MCSSRSTGKDNRRRVSTLLAQSVEGGNLEAALSNGRLYTHSITPTHGGKPTWLVFSEYFLLQLGETIGNGLLVDPIGDFLVSGLFDH
jgi:hypothetical protein